MTDGGFASLPLLALLGFLIYQAYISARKDRSPRRPEMEWWGKRPALAWWAQRPAGAARTRWRVTLPGEVKK